MARQRVSGPPPSGWYSPGVVGSAGVLYVSGQGPIEDGAVVGLTTAEQTTATLRNIAQVLASAGAGLEHVLRCGVYLADLSDFAEMDAAYRAFFSAPPPARSTIGAALLGIRVEIDCIAQLPQKGHNE